MKTIKEIRFDNLWTLYSVLKKAGMEQAFEAQFQEILQQCADELYEGNTEHPVLLRALFNNLISDKRTRFRNPERYFNGYLPQQKELLEFVDLLETLLPERQNKVAPKAQAKTGKKVSWAFTEEDLDNLDTKALKAWKVNISSLKSKGRDEFDEPTLFYARVEEGLEIEDAETHIDNLLAYADAKIAELAAPQLSNKLLEKLSGEGKAVLSAAEVAELRKLIG